MARIAKLPPKAPLGTGLHRNWYNATIDAINSTQETRERVERPLERPVFLGFVKDATVYAQYTPVKIKAPMVSGVPTSVYAYPTEVEVEDAEVDKPWAIIQAPLSQNYPAPLTLVGETWANVTLSNAAHTHARLDPDDVTGPLLSGFIGQPLLSAFGTGQELIYITPQQQHNILAKIPPGGLDAATSSGTVPSVTSCAIYKQDTDGTLIDLSIDEDILHYGAVIDGASEHDFPYLPLYNSGQFLVVATEYCN